MLDNATAETAPALITFAFLVLIYMFAIIQAEDDSDALEALFLVLS